MGTATSLCRSSCVVVGGEEVQGGEAELAFEAPPPLPEETAPGELKAVAAEAAEAVCAWVGLTRAVGIPSVMSMPPLWAAMSKAGTGVFAPLSLRQ